MNIQNQFDLKSRTEAEFTCSKDSRMSANSSSERWKSVIFTRSSSGMCSSQIKNKEQHKSERVWSICLLQWAVPSLAHTLPFSISNELLLVNKHCLWPNMVNEMNPQRFLLRFFSISSSAKILRFEEGEVIIDYKMLKATNVPKFGHQQQRTSILRFLYLDMQFSIETNLSAAETRIPL